MTWLADLMMTQIMIKAKPKNLRSFSFAFSFSHSSLSWNSSSLSNMKLIASILIMVASITASRELTLKEMEAELVIARAQVKYWEKQYAEMAESQRELLNDDEMRCEPYGCPPPGHDA
mmetsp:Transcript_46957/g.75184  ORF Transcript_46957/g.75184 Transcript_46957/m.75184 type:complete len:118 (+) Transcript_46957:338-691(+)